MIRVIMTVLVVFMMIASSVTCFAAETPFPPGGVESGSVTLGGEELGEAIITAEDIPWIIEQGRLYGESTELGLIWSDEKDPEQSFYLGGYNIPAQTDGRTKEQVVQGIREYLDTYKGYGDVDYFYIEILPNCKGHYTVYVYRG